MKYLLVTLSASLFLSVAATAGPVITFTNVSNLASSDNTTFLVNNTDLATSFTMGGPVPPAMRPVCCSMG